MKNEQPIHPLIKRLTKVATGACKAAGLDPSPANIELLIEHAGTAAAAAITPQSAAKIKVQKLRDALTKAEALAAAAQ